MKPDLYIYYDGCCPVCSRYVAYRRLTEKYNVSLVDVRLNTSEVKRVLQKQPNLDFNETMAVEVGDTVFAGAEAIRFIEKHSCVTSPLSQFVSLLLSDKTIGPLYPLLVIFRKTLLFLLGRPQL